MMDLYETISGCPIDRIDIIEWYEEKYGYTPDEVTIDEIIEDMLESGKWSVG